MKSRTVYSRGATAISIGVPLCFILAIAIMIGRGDTVFAIVFAACTAVLFLAALFYAPLYISLSGGVLSIHRSLRVKDIAVPTSRRCVCVSPRWVRYAYAEAEDSWATGESSAKPT